MNIKYYWKQISADGLVKEPEEAGPYYSRDTLNGWCGFESEEEAEQALIKWFADYKYGVGSDFVLVKIYNRGGND